MTLDQLRQALQAANAQAWLRVVREGESSQDDEKAFHEFYGGRRFESLDDHPRQHFPLPNGENTSAAGAFQITESTWNDYTRIFGAKPFDVENQSLCALWLTDRAGALKSVLAGRLDEATARCARVWTSLAIPKRQQEAPEIFAAYGGSVESQAPQAAPEVVIPQTVTIAPIPIPKAKPMGVLAALLPTIIQMIPQLSQLFGSGSEVSNRNIAAAKVVADTVVAATQSTNVQDAIEKMQGDGTVLQAARDAVSEILPQLLDVGGGVESARKFAAEHENGRYGRILEVVSYCAMFFLLLANCMSAAAAYILQDASVMADVKQADIGAALIAFGYFLGSSISSKRKDEMAGSQ